MSDAKMAWGLLAESVGDYSGPRVNQEKQSFNGALSLKFDFENKSLSMPTEQWVHRFVN